FGDQCRRKNMRISQCSTDSRYWKILNSARSGGQPSTSDRCRLVRRIVSKCLLRLEDIRIPQVKFVILIKGVINAKRHLRYRCVRDIRCSKIALNKRIVRIGGEGGNGINYFCQGTFPIQGYCILLEGRSLI